MSQGTERTRLRQALWIAAGVIVLTVVVLILSWLSAGPGEVMDPGLAPVTPITTTEVDRPTFTPEKPAGTRPSPLPPPPSTVGVEDLPPEPSINPVTPPAPRPVAPAQASPPPAAPAAKAPPTAPLGAFGVQVGAFGSETSVREMKTKLERLGYRVVTQPTGNLTRVIAAGYPDRAAAQKALDTLRGQGLSAAQIIPLE